MAHLTLARKIAAIALTLWKRGVCFDPEELKPQAALAFEDSASDLGFFLLGLGRRFWERLGSRESILAACRRYSRLALHPPGFARNKSLLLLHAPSHHRRKL